MTELLEALRDGAWMPLGVIIVALAWCAWFVRRAR
jgi:hypothetical protein